MICDLAAGYLEAFASAGFRGSQPELEGNRIVLNATKQAPAPQASKIWGRASHLPTKGGVVEVEVRKGPLPPFPFPCEGQFPQHYKYSAGGALPGPG